MGSNIKYLPEMYWDFWDHYLPLTERSLQEVLELVGFKVERCIPKFLLSNRTAEKCVARLGAALFEVSLGSGIFLADSFDDQPSINLSFSPDEQATPDAFPRRQFGPGLQNHGRTKSFAGAIGANSVKSSR
jgi:hypothetical protein